MKPDITSERKQKIDLGNEMQETNALPEVVSQAK